MDEGENGTWAKAIENEEEFKVKLRKMTKNDISDALEDQCKEAKIIRNELKEKDVNITNLLQDKTTAQNELKVKVVVIQNLEQEKKDLQDELGNMRKEKDKIEVKLNEELGEKKMLIDELTHANTKWDEKNKLAVDLMNRLDERESEMSENKPKPKVVIIIWGAKEIIVQCIESISDASFVVCTEIESVQDLMHALENPKFRSMMKNHQKAIIQLGTKDIQDGIKGSKVAHQLLVAVKDLQNTTGIDVAIIQLSPSTITKRNTDIYMFNGKLNKTDTNSKTQIISTENEFEAAKSKVIGQDGFTLLPKGEEIVANAITTHLTLPEPKPDSNDVNESHNPDYDVDIEVCEVITIPKEIVGKVIGEKGACIRDIQSKSETEIVVNDYTQWEEELKGAFITGKRKCIDSAKDAIRIIIQETDVGSKGRAKKSKDKTTQASKRSKKF